MGTGRVRILLGLLAFGAALGVAGCQTSGGRPFMPESVENPANGRAYVYWPGQRWREKAGKYPEVQIDGVPVGVLHYKTYLKLELPPGKHEFRVTAFSEAANWDVDDKYFTTRLTLSPVGDALTLEFAKSLVQNEKLGQNDVPDYLSISFF